MKKKIIALSILLASCAPQHPAVAATTDSFLVVLATCDNGTYAMSINPDGNVFLRPDGSGIMGKDSKTEQDKEKQTFTAAVSDGTQVGGMAFPTSDYSFVLVQDKDVRKLCKIKDIKTVELPAK